MYEWGVFERMAGVKEQTKNTLQLAIDTQLKALIKNVDDLVCEKRRDKEKKEKECMRKE